MRSLQNFSKVFNSNNFSVINPFLNADRFEALKKVAGEALLQNKIGSPVSPLYHVPGSFVDYKKFSFNLSGDLVGDFVKQSPHPALAYMPSWFREKDISYWLRDEIGFIENMAKSALEDGIDPVYVSKYACIRLVSFTSSWAFKKWCVVDDSVNFGLKKIVVDTQYSEILVSDRANSTVSVATKQYPLLIKNLSPYSEVHPQYISSVLLDVPLSYFDPKSLFANMRDRDGFLIPNDFYRVLKAKYDEKEANEKKANIVFAKIEDFFKNEEIKNYHCGGKGFSYSDQITHFAGFKGGGSNGGCTIDFQPIVPFDS